MINENISPRSFKRSVCHTFPKEYVLHYNAIETMAERHYKKRTTDYAGLTLEAYLPWKCDEMRDWYEQEFLGQHDRRKSLVLYGASRLGKTDWARSLDPKHMYFQFMCNFKEDWNDEAKYIIFDDIEWEFIPNKKCFFGGQKQFVISDKYSAKRTVQWNKVCICLCNEMPKFKSATEEDWYQKNCVFIELLDKLY